MVLLKKDQLLEAYYTNQEFFLESDFGKVK